MINVAVIEGRIVQNLELKKGANEKEYVLFTLASERSFSEETDFIDCICFGNVAKNLCQYMKKGSRIIVSGEIETNTYTDKNEAFHKSTKIVVNEISYPDKKNTDFNVDDIEIPEN